MVFCFSLLEKLTTTNDKPAVKAMTWKNNVNRHSSLKWCTQVKRG